MDSDDAVGLPQEIPNEIGKPNAPMARSHGRQALIPLCLVMLVVISNASGITIALPTIKADLNLSDTAFVWVVNAYNVTYGGALLLFGRLGDLVGHRSVYAWGLIVFTVASVGCGLSSSSWELIAARSVQGVAGAAISTATLAFIARLFEHSDERTKALGVYVFACSAGGLIGLLLSGLLTGVLNWRYIFLANVPVGIAAYLVYSKLLPDLGPDNSTRHIDFLGAATVTLTVSLAVYTVINASQIGWVSVQSFATFITTMAAFALFLFVERRAAEPLFPLSVLRNRNLVFCCAINTLYSAATPGGVFISLFLQRVLGYSPLQAGMAFIPASIVTAVFALGFSARLVVRYGTKAPLLLGLCACVGGFALFARAPVSAGFVIDALPGLILIGLGAGAAYNPILVEAMRCLPERDAGLASGVITTSSVLGGALGLATLASVAVAGARETVIPAMNHVATLNAGYHVAFLTAAATAGASAVSAILYFPRAEPASHSSAC